MMKFLFLVTVVFCSFTQAGTKILVKDKNGVITNVGMFEKAADAAKWLNDQKNAKTLPNNFTSETVTEDTPLELEVKRILEKAARKQLLSGLKDKDLTNAELKQAIKALIEASE